MYNTDATDIKKRFAELRWLRDSGLIFKRSDNKCNVAGRFAIFSLLTKVAAGVNIK